MLLGPNLLTGSLQRFLPEHWRPVGRATSTFKKHIAESIKEEKELIAEGKNHRGNFISAMVRASEGEARTFNASSGRHFHGLTETEIFGNIFVFNFACHDSIAITLTYVLSARWHEYHLHIHLHALPSALLGYRRRYMAHRALDRDELRRCGKRVRFRSRDPVCPS